MVSILIERTEETKDGCWLYTGAKWKNGYGVVQYRGRQWGTHRLMYYLLFRDSWNPDLVVMHTCPNQNIKTKTCINPMHLQQGTQQENMDMYFKKGKYVEKNQQL